MLDRRKFLKTGTALGVSSAVSPLAMPALSQNARIKIGYVSPQSGALAGFAESDNYNVAAFAASDVGKNFEVIVKDSQSNPNRAADVTRDLILSDEVAMIVVASTPETTNPVATTCELEGMPVISTKAPWEPWFIGQQGNPADPSSWRAFDFAFHYFWGQADLTAVHLNMWNQIETNRIVAGMFPNDADGNALGDPVIGLPAGYAVDGYSVIDPGRYQNLTDDFSAQISQFRNAGCDLVTGAVLPPDFTTFWTQAKQQGFEPKVCSVAKAILFPASVEVLGQAGHNLSCEIWWSAQHPYASSLTGQNSQQLAEDYTDRTGKPWTQPIGFIHSLFEVASNVMGRVSDVTNPDDIAAAIAGTDMSTIVGPVVWPGTDVPDFAATNVTKTPLVGGQWRQAGDGSFDLVVVENTTAPEVPLGGQMEALS